MIDALKRLASTGTTSPWEAQFGSGMRCRPPPARLPNSGGDRLTRELGVEPYRSLGDAYRVRCGLERGWQRRSCQYLCEGSTLLLRGHRLGWT